MKYKYEIIRSARKSVSVSVSSTNKITVRCPWGMRPEQIENFLDSKSDWIEKVILKNSEKLAVNDDIIELREIYLEGKRLRLVFGNKDKITDEYVCVKNVSRLEKLYEKFYFPEFLNRVKGYSERAMLYPASVSVKSYKGRWGCCDSKNNIIFNYKLFMLPRRIQDYVIIHELCHTLCHNHSPAFWKLVSEFIPDYKAVRAELRNFDFLTALY